MAHFTAAFTEFFEQLDQHQDREWFKVHKQHYEQVVALPFMHFVALLRDKLAASYPDGLPVYPASESIFRLYRDTRFSPDKRPYKTFASAILNGRRQDFERPGFYLEIGLQGVHLYGGLYAPNREQLHKIRESIWLELHDWQQALSDPAFKATFGGKFQGERNKILPEPFRQIAASNPLLLHKQFYYHASLPPEHITRPDLAEQLLQWCAAGQPVNTLLWRALSYHH